MPNTVYGPFVPITCVNGVTPLNATWGNNGQTQASVAMHGFNPDLVGAGFVEFGIIAYKDRTTANQLDITNGTAYVVMSDGTIGGITVVSTTQTTSALNSTYNLYLQPDGTWYWSTSNSPATNSLYIAQVTTDGSGNISGVTDKRTLVASAFPNLVGTLELPAPLAIQQTQNSLYAGTVNGTVTFGQTGALANDYNTAALFNGTTGYISLPSTSLPTGNGNWTLEAWFKTSTTGVNQFILAIGGSSSKTAGLLYLNTSNKLVGDLFSSSITSTGTFTNGVYHHAIFTWDGTNGNLYADGSLVAGPTALGPNNLSALTAYIGAQNSGGIVNYFNGTLDEVAIYGTALSSSRVTAHFNAATSTTTGAYAAAVLADSPLRYYRLGDAVGATMAADTISATLQQIVGPDASITTPGNVTATGSATVSGTLDLGTVGHHQQGGFSGVSWFVYDKTNNGFIVQASSSTFILSPAITSLGGQATAGSFGVPVIVAQALRQHVTTTSAVNIISYSVPASGIYRVVIYLVSIPGSSSGASLSIAWTDPDSNAVTTWNLFSSSTLTANFGVSQGSNPIAAKASTSIVVQYRNTTGTPNDYVTAMVERLA